MGLIGSEKKSDKNQYESMDVENGNNVFTKRFENLERHVTQVEGKCDRTNLTLEVMGGRIEVMERNQVQVEAKGSFVENTVNADNSTNLNEQFKEIKRENEPAAVNKSYEKQLEDLEHKISDALFQIDLLKDRLDVIEEQKGEPGLKQKDKNSEKLDYLILSVKLLEARVKLVERFDEKETDEAIAEKNKNPSIEKKAKSIKNSLDKTVPVNETKNEKN